MLTAYTGQMGGAGVLCKRHMITTRTGVVRQ